MFMPCQESLELAIIRRKIEALVQALNTLEQEVNSLYMPYMPVVYTAHLEHRLAYLEGCLVPCVTCGNKSDTDDNGEETPPIEIPQ